MTRFDRGAMLATAFLTTVVMLSTVPARADDTGPMKRRCCGISFSDGRDLVRHMIPKHKAEGCLRCGVLFEELEDAAVHAVVSHTARSCLLCDKQFKGPKVVARHLIEVHEVKGCAACGVVFENREQEKKHVARCPEARHETAKGKEGGSAGDNVG